MLCEDCLILPNRHAADCGAVPANGALAEVGPGCMPNAVSEFQQEC